MDNTNDDERPGNAENGGKCPRGVLRCRHCGDPFDGPERDCPSPDAGKHPLVDSGRGGHRFAEPPPKAAPEPLTAERLQEIRALHEKAASLNYSRSIDNQCVKAIPELLTEVARLQSECKRLLRVGLENARIGGDPVFTREQIERIMDDDAPPRRKRG